MGVARIPKVLVSLRIDEELMKKLNKRASELGVGVTALMRRYLEFMLSHETTKSYPVMCVPSAEYAYLVRVVVSNAGEMNRYIDYVSELYKNLIQIYLGESPEVGEVLRRFLEMLKLEGKVLEFRFIVEKDVVSLIITTVSEENALLLSKILEKVLAPRKVEARCMDKMVFLRVRRF